MKYFLTFLMAIMITVVAMAHNAAIVLSYDKGKELKFYNSDQLAEAIDSAEVNDTIYFGIGNYKMDYLSSLTDYDDYGIPGETLPTINKPLTLIGAGAQEGGTSFSIRDRLIIDIDSSLEDSEKSLSFEGISFDNEGREFPIVIISSLQELKFSNSRFDETFNLRNESSSANINNLIIDRCSFVDCAIDQSTVNKVYVTNTKIIRRLFGDYFRTDLAMSFDHCYIRQIEPHFGGLIQHSIIYYSQSPNIVLENCCYCGRLDEIINKDDCIDLSFSGKEPESIDDDPSSYGLGLCNDGTPYGTTGGISPFTLYTQYPTPDTSLDEVTNKPKSFIEYNPITKKLVVQVKCIGE